MKYISFIAGLFLILSPAFSQETFPLHTSFSWKDIEQKATPAQIDAFIAQNRKGFLQFGEQYRPLDSLRKRLHFLDLNGDKLPDVVFEGESGGEAQLIEIYLNTGKGYKYVFSSGQGIEKIDWRDNRLYRLYIRDWGCCEDQLNTNKIYQLSYDKQDAPKFVQIYQSYFLRETIYPDSMFPTPIRFQVLNDRYKIRFSPAVDDTTKQDWLLPSASLRGNNIALLVKGAVGTALGKKTDATGREWWFVEMDEEYYPAKSDVLLDADKLEFPTKVLGWVSSRFVKTL